jgi:type VI secretion system protein ImpA
MSDLVYSSDELLRPLSAEQPCGQDLRYAALFNDISEARRADDELSFGAWEPEGGRKLADWNRVARLCRGALAETTKDLRIACYLAEAALWLDGFAGLRDCLRLIAELLRRFWDQGLFPAIEDGDTEYRASALAWLNDRLPGVIAQVPITAAPGGPNYGLTRYQQAQRVGTEAAIASASGEKRATIDALRAQGWISLDEFDAALVKSDRAALEAIYRPFEEARQSLLDLEKAVDERFGPSAPTFSDIGEALKEIGRILSTEWERRRRLENEKEAPESRRPEPESARQPAAAGVASGTVVRAAGTGDGAGWDEAEHLVRNGEIDRGLALMAALAAGETSGRGRFLRKLALADVCLKNGRQRLARTVLEELNRLIEEHKLAQWEGSEVAGAVWSRLYRLCRNSDAGSDQELAGRLYNEICHLDPWQAYISCED